MLPGNRKWLSAEAEFSYYLTNAMPLSIGRCFSNTINRNARYGCCTRRLRDDECKQVPRHFTFCCAFILGCAMSGKSRRPNGGEDYPPGTSSLMLVSSADHTHWPVSSKPMASLHNPSVEGQSLLCTETLPSSTPPADDAQLPAHASINNIHVTASSWTKAHQSQLPTKDVQFALIVPETFLASHPHVLARVPLVSTGEDGHGASGAVLTVGADISVQDGSRSGGSVGQLLTGQTVYREVSLIQGSAPPAASNSTINGIDGQRLVSSSAILLPALTTRDNHEHLTHLAEVAVRQKPVPSSSSPSTSQQQSPQSPPATLDSPVSEGMHSGRPGTGSGHTQGQGHPPSSTSQDTHHPQTMLSAGASAGPSAGMGVGVFRGSLTHGEPVSRVLSVGSGSSQYGSGSGGNGSSSVSPYSLYNVPGQSSPMTSISPYSTFFHQYPSTHYSPAASLVASGRYPHIESYSAVLASMGSHVQHGGHAGHASPHSQVSGRPPFIPGNLGQYPHRSMSSSSSPGPGPSSTHSPPGAAPSYSARERESLLQQSRERERDRSPQHHLSPLSVSDTHPDDKSLLHSPGLSFAHRGSPGALLKESPKGDPRDPRDPFHKLPSGKEGSLKHRILTRPPDIPLEAAYPESKLRSQAVKNEEDAPAKRTKYGMGPAASASSPPDPHVFMVPHALGPGPPGSHYSHDRISRSSPSTHPSSAAATSSAASSLYPPRTSPPGSGSSPTAPGLPSHLHYPPHFIKGSIIQLANGDLKRVEDLQTDDFVSSAQVSADLKVDSSTVVRIEEHPELGTATLGFSVGEHRVQVTVEATLEHPFFVFGQGWSSCSTDRTLQRYGLECHKLSVGDVCISLTHKDVTLRAAEIVSQQQQQASSECSRVLAAESSKDSQHVDAEGSGNGGKIRHGQKDEPRGSGHGQVQGNGIGGSSVSDTSSGSGGVGEMSKSGEGSGSGGQSSGQMAPPSPTDSQSSPTDTRPPRKRRWSAPESDVEKEKLELEKQNSDPSQKQD
ncbi:hypothetical protein BaRGS_00003034 [Batillaria attramentaria]|uniref:AXH domain-containing protein n=1 Tax=Batillaria attramentaria TaxID=370345 RepID=A0ABD0M250_9CAEN